MLSEDGGTHEILSSCSKPLLLLFTQLRAVDVASRSTPQRLRGRLFHLFLRQRLLELKAALLLNLRPASNKKNKLDPAICITALFVITNGDSLTHVTELSS